MHATSTRYARVSLRSVVETDRDRALPRLALDFRLPLSDHRHRADDQGPSCVPVSASGAAYASSAQEICDCRSVPRPLPLHHSLFIGSRAVRILSKNGMVRSNSASLPSASMSRVHHIALPARTGPISPFTLGGGARLSRSLGG